MSLTLLPWPLFVAAIVMAALLVFRLRSSRFGFGPGAAGGTLIVAAAVFLLVAGIGAAISYLKDPATTTASGDPIAVSPSRSGSDGEMLARLNDYTHSIETMKPASTAAAGKLLPDVNTMIERLAARLKTTPDDTNGWRMLGWSYFNTGRYEQAASAYGKALERDPKSADLKRSYEEAKAKAKAAGGDKLEAASALHAETVGKSGSAAHVDKIAQPAVKPLGEHDAAIRSMVDGLADRLERSPRDVDGWTRLMRSRLVLGEKERAATAFRKALEVFKNDSAASNQITAAATELGLKTE